MSFLPAAGGAGGGRDAACSYASTTVELDQAVLHAHVIENILMLINAIVGFPPDLKERVTLRAEFIRLQLLDVLSALHRERHVDVVRQVEVFESEMLEDTEEIAKLGNDEAALEASGANSNALDVAVGSPLQLLQEKVLLCQHTGMLPRLLGVLRALTALPDSPVGLVAWSYLEKVVENTATTAAKHTDADKAREDFKKVLHIQAAPGAAPGAVALRGKVVEPGLADHAIVSHFRIARRIPVLHP